MLLQETQIPPQDEQRRDNRAPTGGRSMSDDVPVTAAARKALQTELSLLRDEMQREIPARLRVAREFGDSANNDEHLAIREEQAVLAARIARLEDILRRAVLVEHVDGSDTVAIGSRVSVLDLQTDKTLEYVIEAAHAARVPGAVSARSPVGRALLGRRPGDRVLVELPDGRQRAFELRAIGAPTEQSNGSSPEGEPRLAAAA